MEPANAGRNWRRWLFKSNGRTSQARGMIGLENQRVDFHAGSNAQVHPGTRWRQPGAGTTHSILDLFVGVGLSPLPVAGGLGPWPGVPEVVDDIGPHAARDRGLGGDP